MNDGSASPLYRRLMSISRYISIAALVVACSWLAGYVLGSAAL
jgi:hypothetical protein